MKTLIVYCSMHGTTEKAAHLLSEWIEGDVQIVDLKKDGVLIDIRNYDSIIIGGSIHVGSIQARINYFIEKNLPILMTKNIGLFICCWHDGLLAIEQFKEAFPKELREKSIANGIFGGEFLISKMGFIEKQFVEYISGIYTDTSNFDPTAVLGFAMKFNASLAMNKSLV